MATEPLVGVPVQMVRAIWPVIEPMVDRCFKKAKEHRMAPEHVLTMLLDRSLQLWIYESDGEIKSIIITQILNHPLAKECNVFMIVGILPDDWKQSIEQVEEWAISVGCTHMTAAARRGFIKLSGWDELQTYCVRAL